MICSNCGSKTLEENPSARITQEFRGETFNLTTPAYVCSKCGELTLSDNQATELLTLTVDSYKTAHGLLTSGEIRAIRKDRNLSQRQFADLIGVGEASIKRWETWHVQEKGSDEKLRAFDRNGATIEDLLRVEWIGMLHPFKALENGMRVPSGRWEPHKLPSILHSRGNQDTIGRRQVVLCDDSAFTTAA